MSHQAIVQHIPAMRRYARSLTGDVWAADDLVQDTLERACSKWRLWLAGTDLRAWLFTVMHNIFISDVRSVQRRSGAHPAVPLEDAAHELQAPPSTADLQMDLQRCLLQLPPDQRAVLLLVTMEDLGYAEVAKITGVPVGTVMSRLSRARERMRELMTQQSSKPALHARATTDTVAHPPALRRLK